MRARPAPGPETTRSPANGSVAEGCTPGSDADPGRAGADARDRRSAQVTAPVSWHPTGAIYDLVMSLGLDLHLDLSPVRPGRSLEAALRAAILDGRLSPDTRLPAARTLAADLGISRNTVADVYAQLAAEGWLESRVGAGTWVSVRTPSYVQAGLRQRTVRRRWIDLRGGIPDTAGFARREWASAARQATLDATTAELGYPDPAGTTRLRGALTSYLARTRGVAVERERVVVGQDSGSCSCSCAEPCASAARPGSPSRSTATTTTEG